MSDNIEKINNTPTSDYSKPKQPNDPDFLNHRLNHHYWIRTDDMDPNGLLSEFYELRGVSPVVIPSWHSDDFYNLMKQCFNI